MEQDSHISEIISRIVDRLAETYRPEKMILFGSYAYGKPTRESDIDLLIIKETKDRPVDRRIIVRKIVSDIRKKTPFSSLVLTPEELSNRLSMGDGFFIEITTKGRLLYER